MAKKKAAAKRATKAAPLLQYLVVINQAMDDIPYILIDNKIVARGAAMGVPDDGLVPREMAKALGIDQTTPIGVSIITFQDGIPVKREIVREYQ